ncbi:MAG TPA: hypothetical protein VIG47_14480 [Gemmatimonadaceae bacterium]
MAEDAASVNILLVSESDWQSRAIQMATHGIYNHAGVLMSDGTLIEALSTGIVRTQPPYYTNVKTATAIFPVDAEDKAAADKWLLTVVGDKYDLWNIVAFGVNFLTNGNVILGQKNEYICSALAAEYVTRAGFEGFGDPRSISPNDIARMAKIPC